MKSNLTLEQAYENIAQAVAAYRGTLADHQLLQQSLELIRQALEQFLKTENQNEAGP